MFEFLKNIFVSKSAEANGNGHGHPVAATEPQNAESRVNPSQRAFANAAMAAKAEGPVIAIPLLPVLSMLPPELKMRARGERDPGAATFPLPLNAVLAQLPTGAVRVSFGELRRWAPDFFSSEGDRDQMPVSLPLHEILSRVDPALLARRQNQKHIDVPEEIGSPFGDRGHGLAFSVASAKPVTPAPLASRGMAPATPANPAVNIPAIKAPIAVPSRPVTSHPPSAIPVPQIQPVKPVPFRSSITATPTPPPPAATPAGTVPAPIPFSQFTRNPGSPSPTSPAQPKSAAAGQPVRTGPAADMGATLTVALGALLPAWPEALRLEIVQLSLGDAKVAVPLSLIDEGLKRGRVIFPWKMLRSWIRPSPLPSVSAHDNAMLELPLSVIAPLFIANQKQAKAQPKVAVDESIPNLFFGFPQAEPPAPAFTEAPAAPISKGMDTNYYVWDDTSESAKVDETEFKRKGGTDFVTRYATPNEVVSRAAALEGVAGALIALPDGLMVASKLSADLNGDTLAAFLPHIFGKVSQCTKELRMGELNNLNFTVGNVPWKIFRVNAIFFATFGYAAQALPTAQLAALASELDHKKQQ